MLHHVFLGARDLDASARFYDRVLAPLGHVRVWSDLRPDGSRQAVGYGAPGGGDRLAVKQIDRPTPPIPGFHVALAAPSRDAVRALRAAALAAGGTDRGAPGLRPHDGPHDFAAFVVDLDGHRVEAVCDAADDAAAPG